MIRVYVAGCYSADNVLDVLKNIGRGEKACATIWKLGFAPFCPWHDKSYQMEFCEEDFPVNKFYDYSMAWLEVSDAVCVIGDIANSKGCAMELKRARELGLPIFYSIEALVDGREALL